MSFLPPEVGCAKHAARERLVARRKDQFVLIIASRRNGSNAIAPLQPFARRELLRVPHFYLAGKNAIKIGAILLAEERPLGFWEIAKLALGI